MAVINTGQTQSQAGKKDRFAALRHKRSYFSPSHRWGVAIAFVAALLGLWGYASRVTGTYRNVYREMRDVVVAREILAQDPTQVVPLAPGRTEKPEASPTKSAPEQKAGSGPDPLAAISQDADLRKLFRALQLLRLQTDEDTFESFDQEKTNARMIRQAAAEPRAALNGDSPPAVSFVQSPTLEFVVHIASRIPNARNEHTGDTTYHKDFADLLAALMANQPGAARAFRDAMHEFRTSRKDPEPRALMAELGDNLRLRPAIAKLDLLATEEDQIRSEPLSNVELISSLYELNGVSAAYDSTKPPANEAEREARENLRVLTSFLQSLLEHMRADHQVKAAAKQIPLWEGYEQCAMMMIFAWIMLILLVREVNRWRAKAHVRKIEGPLDAWLAGHPDMNYQSRAAEAEEIKALSRRLCPGLSAAEDDERPPGELGPKMALVCANNLLATRGKHAADERGFRSYCRDLRRAENESRWFLKWLAMALPAIGFIGTKRGIAGALSQADIIVRAQDPGAQAVAISTVTGILGIAFTTTLIALIMGLFTSLLTMAQSQREAALMESLERSLLPLLDPDAYDRPAPAPAGANQAAVAAPGGPLAGG